MALLNNVIPFTLLVWGQTRVASGAASIILATTPIFTTILAHYFTTDEKMTTARAVGVGFGVFGVFVMLGTASLASLGGNFIGELAIVASAFAYGASSVFARRFTTLGIPPLAVSAGLLSCSTVMLFPILLVVDRPWTLPWLSLRGGPLRPRLRAILATALAYILYFRIVATAGATNLMLVTFLMPVTAILLRRVRAARNPRTAPHRRHGADRDRPCSPLTDGCCGCSAPSGHSRRNSCSKRRAAARLFTT